MLLGDIIPDFRGDSNAGYIQKNADAYTKKLASLLGNFDVTNTADRAVFKLGEKLLSYLVEHDKELTNGTDTVLSIKTDMTHQHPNILSWFKDKTKVSIFESFFNSATDGGKAAQWVRDWFNYGGK